MSKEQAPPLVSDEQMVGYREGMSPGERLHATDLSAFAVRSIYEQDRQKTREVVQSLVDAIVDNANYRLLTEGEEGDTLSDFMNLTLNAALAIAKSINIEPTKP